LTRELRSISEWVALAEMPESAFFSRLPP